MSRVALSGVIVWVYTNFPRIILIVFCKEKEDNESVNVPKVFENVVLDPCFWFIYTEEDNVTVSTLSHPFTSESLRGLIRYLGVLLLIYLPRGVLVFTGLLWTLTQYWIFRHIIFSYVSPGLHFLPWGQSRSHLRTVTSFYDHTDVTTWLLVWGRTGV